MFDIGWSEMAVIALVALMVIGPKELPRMMKTAAQWMRKARSLTREFQSGLDEIVREAELEDARKALESTRGGNLQRTIANAIDPDDELTDEVKSVEQEARREDTSRADDAKAAKDDAGAKDDDNAGGDSGRAAAKRVTHPASVAPAHSLKPPADKPAENASGGSADSPAGGSDGAEKAKPASQDSKQSA